MLFLNTIYRVCNQTLTRFGGERTCERRAIVDIHIHRCWCVTESSTIIYPMLVAYFAINHSSFYTNDFQTFFNRVRDRNKMDKQLNSVSEAIFRNTDLNRNATFVFFLSSFVLFEIHLNLEFLFEWGKLNRVQTLCKICAKKVDMKHSRRNIGFDIWNYLCSNVAVYY